MIYIVMAILVVAFIYFNVLGLFRGYGELPDTPYKQNLWRYKKLELIEKGVISAIFVCIVFAMKYYADQVAAISLAATALILILEYFFGRFMRKAMVCPKCGAPVWNGNFIVILKPRKYCSSCHYPLAGIPMPGTSVPDSEEREDEK